MPEKKAVDSSAIRIVPMVDYRRPPLPRHPPPPTGVAYMNGPLISSAQVHSLFWVRLGKGPRVAYSLR